MDMRPVKIEFWVNSACFWFYCVFLQGDFGNIIRLNSEVEKIVFLTLKETYYDCTTQL